MAAPTFSCCDLALRNFPGAADLAADLHLLIELICKKKMQLPLIVINTVVAFVNAATITIITMLVLKVQYYQQHYADPMKNRNDHLHLSGWVPDRG